MGEKTFSKNVAHIVKKKGGKSKSYKDSHIYVRELNNVFEIPLRRISLKASIRNKGGNYVSP